jgi:hypothetical protein
MGNTSPSDTTKHGVKAIAAKNKTLQLGYAEAAKT